MADDVEDFLAAVNRVTTGGYGPEAILWGIGLAPLMAMLRGSARMAEREAESIRNSRGR